MKRRTWPLWAYYAIAAVVFLLDYVTKKLVVRYIDLHAEIEVLGNFFVLTSIRNRGAAFGMLQEQRLFFLIVTVVVVAGIVWYFHRSHRTGSPLLLTAIAMILGGALGNFIDRARVGEVVDFLQFNFGSLGTFPIFTLADTGICVGVGLVLLDSLLAWRQESKSKQDEGKGVHEEEQQSV